MSVLPCRRSRLRLGGSSSRRGGDEPSRLPQPFSAASSKIDERARHERQVEALGASLRQHGAQILADRVDVEGGRAGILARQRLGDIGPAHLEDVRAARGVGEEVHHPRGILAEVLRQGIGLAERLVEDDERQVDRELHARAGADRADMLEAPAELLEDRPGAGDIRLLAARKADAACRRAPGRRCRRRGTRRRPRPWREPPRRAAPRSRAARCSCR